MTKTLIVLGLIIATCSLALTGHHGMSIGFGILTGIAVVAVF